VGNHSPYADLFLIHCSASAFAWALPEFQPPKNVSRWAALPHDAFLKPF
jgi:hypothetical protein